MSTAMKPNVENQFPPVESGTFTNAMRQLAGAVTIVTTRYNEIRTGLTATAVCSVCAEPASILVCVNSTGETHNIMRASGKLCVNVLAADHKDLAMRFAGAMGDKGEARFSYGEWSHQVTGSPALADSLISLDCIIESAIRQGTHSIFVCSVVDVRTNNHHEALAYINGKFVKVRAA